MSATQSSQSTTWADVPVTEYSVGPEPDFDSEQARRRRQDVLAVVRIAASGSGFGAVRGVDSIDSPVTPD